jgi:hypothetical protein
MMPAIKPFRLVRGVEPGRIAAVEALAEHEIVFPSRIALQP